MLKLNFGRRLEQGVLDTGTHRDEKWGTHSDEVQLLLEACKESLPTHVDASHLCEEVVTRYRFSFFLAQTYVTLY